MNFKSILYTGFLITILMSCGTKYEYWNLSKFNLKQDALSKNEEVRIIYCSSGPDFNKDMEYYFHLVAVSKKTGDTVNILSLINHITKKEDLGNTFYFIDQNDESVKSFLSLTDDTFDLVKTGESVNISNKNMKEIPKVEKVARDPEFDFIADNNFPTVLGVIATEVSYIKKY